MGMELRYRDSILLDTAISLLLGLQQLTVLPSTAKYRWVRRRQCRAFLEMALLENL